MTGLSFNIPALLLTALVTVLCCYLVVRDEGAKIKYFYIVFFLAIFLYSGAGGCLSDVNPKYRIYNYIYLIVFSLSTLLYKNASAILYKIGLAKRRNPEKVKRLYSSDTLRMTRFIKIYGDYIIVLFLLLTVIDLIYPAFRLSLLVHPPSPDIHNRLEFYRNAEEYTSPFDRVRLLVAPFFYWSMYKYRKSLLKSAGILLSLLYIGYCASGYVSRGTMLTTILIIFFAYFFSVNKQMKKRLLLLAGIGGPFLIVFFVIFSYIRVGDAIGSISLSGAVGELLQQEIDSPRLFDRYIAQSGKLVREYFEWLFLLPLPGALKFGHGGTLFNELFTNVALGRYNWESDFSIALPGIVGESIFIFKKFFFIHAMILSFLIHIVMRYVVKYPQFLYFYIYIGLRFAQGIPRGGTTGTYSYLAKAFLFFVIAVFIIKRSIPLKYESKPLPIISEPKVRRARSKRPGPVHRNAEARG